MRVPDWETDLGQQIREQPAVVGFDAVAYVDSVGEVMVRDTITGAVRWRTPPGLRVLGQLTVTDNAVLANVSQGMVALPPEGCGAATCSSLWLIWRAVGLPDAFPPALAGRPPAPGSSRAAGAGR